MKRCLLTILIIISTFFIYRELKPKFVFIYPEMEKYVSIKVADEDYSTYYLRPKNRVATYYFPLIWDKNKDQEVAFFGKNFSELIKKEEIDFCRLEFYLDKEQNVIDVKKYDGFCIKPFN